ncbi:MAG: hypothetical protein ACYS5V_16995 [Planctomycetota bacterium]|jgi:hypothetical protein
MPIPTFNGTELGSGGQRDLPASPEVRSYSETLPGVDGRYVQPAGRGGRRIAFRAVLQAAGTTPAQAHQDLKTALRARQQLADGRTVASYVGTDGHDYGHCLLLSYRAAGTVSVRADGTACQAAVPVAGIVLQLNP